LCTGLTVHYYLGDLSESELTVVAGVGAANDWRGASIVSGDGERIGLTLSGKVHGDGGGITALAVQRQDGGGGQGAGPGNDKRCKVQAELKIYKKVL
jgi:hypothetical protein